MNVALVLAPYLLTKLLMRQDISGYKWLISNFPVKTSFYSDKNKVIKHTTVPTQKKNLKT